MYHRATGEHVATLDGQYQPYEAADAGVKLCKEYGNALFAPERNNHGHAVIVAAANSFGYRRIYRHGDDKRGWLTNVVSRPVMLDEFEDAVRSGSWSSPDARVLSQMRKFVVNDNGKPEAARGEHDDLVLAAAIGWSVRGRSIPRGNLSNELAAVL
jgi:hypothetical protein